MQHEVLLRWAGISRSGLEHVVSDPVLAVHHFVLHCTRDDEEGWIGYTPTMPGYVYMMSNKKNGPLYTGVTSDLEGRVYEHKTGAGSKFCKRYGLTRLVYCEDHDRIEDAIDREKRIKKWRRSWKLNLIETANPNWADLFETLNH